MTNQSYTPANNKIIGVTVKPFEYGEDKKILSWKVLPVSENGNTPSKTARRNFRNKFGTTVFNNENEALAAAHYFGE